MTLRSRRPGKVVAIPLLLWTAACAPSDSTASATVERSVLPNGATLVRYGPLPATADTLRPDVTIGVMEGEEHDVFGDIRGIEADADGRIYVYDAQTTDIRVFGPDGIFLRRMGRQGEGPGEISEANGMMFDEEGVLWVHDHGKMQMLGLDTEGNEVARSEVPVRSWGYVYSGIVDDRGRFWKATSHSDDERVFPPPTGLVGGRARMYAKWYDPSTETTDSVFLGEAGFRTFVAEVGNGAYSYSGIPFENRMTTVLDPAGGFWMATGERYRVSRLDEQADTVLVLEVAAEPLPVTEADRAAYLERYRELDDPTRLRAAREALDHASDTRPVFDALLVDDVSRLWVRRTAATSEEPRRWDVFMRDGDYAGSVVLDFAASPTLGPRVRNDRLYAVALDELEVPRVVVVTLPTLAGATE